MRFAYAVIAVLALALATSPASALPKKPTVPGQPQVLNNNCSHAQLNTPIGSQCVAQGNRDILEGSQTYHFAYCSSSGAVLCCMTNGFRILDNSCTVVSGETMSPAPFTTAPARMSPARFGLN